MTAADCLVMGSSSLQAPDASQRHHLALIRVVTLLAAIVLLVPVGYAFVNHWMWGLLAVFLYPVVLFVVIVVFETVIRPPD